MKCSVHALGFFALPLLLVGCGKDSAPHPAPAKAEPVAHETELLKLTLTPDAQRRLGIRTVRAVSGSANQVIEVSGEVVVPPATLAGVPTGSASNLAQIGTQQATADGEVARTRALVHLAEIAYKRADALVREEAGSVRGRDEAAAALATAKAAADVAARQRDLLGPPIAGMGGRPTLWVRASLASTEVAIVAPRRPAAIRPLNEPGIVSARTANPVPAPPSASPTAGTVDLFFAFDNRDGRFRVGQRVTVSLPRDGVSSGLSIPAGAIVRDIYGGEWVYRKVAAHAYQRERIEVASEAAGRALLSRGLAADAEVVTDGAPELFGTEFGTPH